MKEGEKKAPAAMLRKVIQAEDNSEIEVWGDGLQTRSFLYIDECIEAIHRLMGSDYSNPVNIGSEEMVSINNLAQIAIKLSGKNLKINNVLVEHTGVRGRNSDNKLIKEVLGWEPKLPLDKGLSKTYEWIKNQIIKKINGNRLIFNNIYENRIWGYENQETFSGSGSTIEVNHFRNIFLPKFITEYDIDIVYDICGDCNWQYNFVKMVTDNNKRSDDNFEYFGFDVSSIALRRAKKKILEIKE